MSSRVIMEPIGHFFEPFRRRDNPSISIIHFEVTFMCAPISLPCRASTRLQIERYGGFENVARRLHLEFSDEDERAFRRRKEQQLEDTHRSMHAALVRQQEKLLRRREECVQ